MSSSDGELSEESSKNVKIRSYVKVKDHNEDKDYSRRSRDEFYSDHRRRRSRNHGYSRNRSPDEGCEKRGHYEYSDNDDDNSDVKFLSRKRKNDNHSDGDERRKNETKADSYENRNTQNKRVMRMENDYQQELHAYKCDKNKKSNGDLHSDIDREKTLGGDGGGSKEEKQEKKKKTMDDIFTRTGGAYIPPSKLRELQEGITDKSSAAYQRMSWEALKKSINGLVNKVNISNISFIVQEMMSENIVRGRGLAAMSIIRAQVASPTFSHVYAALVAIINTKFPNIGELLLRRLIIQFRKSFKRNDKAVCMNSLKFIAHLINQQVAHEILALEVLTLLLQEPSGDSVEVAISFLKEIGSKLNDVSPKGMEAVFEKLRNILHHSETERRVQYMIEVIFAMRRENFQQFPSMIQELDLVEEDDQITHLLRIDDAGDGENILNVFKYDPNFVENEEKYNQIKKDILGESSDSSGDEDEDDDDEEDNDEEDKDPTMQIIDRTETNLVALRRQIYLTIQSSLDFEECAHKMMKINLKEGQQHEFCLMVVECCAQQRSYEKFYGLLGQRFCLLRKEFMQQYVIIFQEQYENCHHLETNKLRNTAKFFSHLLHSDAVTWTVLDVIRLNEDDTTSSSRIFIKILFQELAEYLGIQKLVKRLKDPVIALCLEGIFPRDNPRNTRFAINFFTAIGLGVLTEELREHLKTMPKVSSIAQQIAAAGLNESSSSDSSSDSDSSNSSDSSSTDSSESDSEREQKKTTKSHRSSSDESKHETKKYVSQSNHSRDKSNSHKRHENRSYSKDNKFSREMDERANHSRRR